MLAGVAANVGLVGSFVSDPNATTATAGGTRPEFFRLESAMLDVYKNVRETRRLLFANDDDDSRLYALAL